ncbi:MAG TPA: hypothetical protein VN666_05675 [Nitrospira sp.]|nr:hypothetical protein [Nitrospira sp.]
MSSRRRRPARWKSWASFADDQLSGITAIDEKNVTYRWRDNYAIAK